MVSEQIVVKKGQAEVHSTGLVIGVKAVSVTLKTDLRLTFPDEGTRDFSEAAAGTVWSFKSRGHEYRVIIREVNFLTDTVTIEIRPVAG